MDSQKNNSSIDYLESLSWLPGGPESAQIPSFLRERHYVDFRRPDALAELYWGVTGNRPLA